RGFVASMFGGRKRGIQPTAARGIHEILSNSPQIRDVRWHFRRDFDAGREKWGRLPPNRLGAEFSVSCYRISAFSHFQSANRLRSSSLDNFPVEVCGSSSRNTNASGNCHLAKRKARNSRSSSGVAVAPARNTTAATG